MPLQMPRLPKQPLTCGSGPKGIRYPRSDCVDAATDVWACVGITKAPGSRRPEVGVCAERVADASQTSSLAAGPNPGSHKLRVRRAAGRRACLAVPYRSAARRPVSGGCWGHLEDGDLGA